MTKSPRGSSLVQARDSTDSQQHSHFHHLHKRSSSPYQPDQDHHLYHHNHQHQHRHQQRQVPHEAGAPGNVDSYVTRVVQTVSVIQVVDAAGSPVDVQTHFGDVATVLVDTVSGVTIEAPGPDALGLAPTSEPQPAPDSVLPTSEPEPVPAPVPEASSEELYVEPTSALPPIESSDLPDDGQDDILTSVPSAAESSAFPTISAGMNSTHPSSFHAPANNTSSLRLLAEPESASLSLSNSYSSFSNPRSSSLYTTTTTVFSSSSTASSASNSASGGSTATVGVFGGDGSGDSEIQPQETTSSTDETSDDSTPETGVIVGSVFGSLAGIALVAVLVLLALRWKKRNGGRITLGDDVNRGARALPAAGGPSDDTGAGIGMTQRSLPFGAGALAGAAAKGASREPTTPPAESNERGFYRVSGRKLPSVLQSGGDGYTDPRENPFGNQNRVSTMSGDSVLYRDSQAFFAETGQDGGAGRLAVGSPMRPVSGVPIMRSGPAKTPVTASNPFADPLPELQPPSRDPIGRSLGSQDGSRGSRGSGSRFTEEIR